VAVAAVVGVGWFLACGLPIIACPSWCCRINGVMVSPPIKTPFAQQMHFLASLKFRMGGGRGQGRAKPGGANPWRRPPTSTLSVWPMRHP